MRRIGSDSAMDILGLCIVTRVNLSLFSAPLPYPRTRDDTSPFTRGVGFSGTYV